MTLDTLHRVETPEGVDLELRVAGPAVRFVAWLLDLLLRAIALGVLAIPLAVLDSLGTGIMLLLAFGLEWMYPVLFEVLRDGRTPGKKWMGVQVIQADGTPIGWGPSLLRNLLRTADFLPMLYAAGLLSMIFSGSFRRLGDLAAGTLVVYSEREQFMRANIPPVPPVPPPVPLRLVEQRALIQFAQRGPMLGPARTREIAELARPLLDEIPGAERAPVSYLYRIAAWLIGRRPGGDQGGAHGR